MRAWLSAGDTHLARHDAEIALLALYLPLHLTDTCFLSKDRTAVCGVLCVKPQHTDPVSHTASGLVQIGQHNPRCYAGLRRPYSGNTSDCVATESPAALAHGPTPRRSPHRVSPWLTAFREKLLSLQMCCATSVVSAHTHMKPTARVHTMRNEHQQCRSE